MRKNHAQIQEIKDDSDNELMAHVQLMGDVYTTISSVSCTQEIPAEVTPLIKYKKPTTATVSIFPDSGAGICLAGTQHVHNIGISLKDLTMCNKKVMAVGGTILTCKGWILVQFKIGSRQTQQKLFICDHVDRIYFSREGCLDVGILPSTFPYPMDQEVKVETISADITTFEEKNSTNKVPNENKALPFPPIEENIDKLKDHIINSFTDVFEKSTPFKSMICKPVHIHLKEKATPTAVHVPIPIPIHWKETVKASLDKDVEN